jgi:PAS domain S-box-containing protein
MRDQSAALDFDPAIQKKLLGWLVVTLVIVAMMAAAAIQNNRRQAESVASANHTHAFISETDAMLASLHAAEASEGAYFLTGDAEMKRLVTRKFADVEKHLKRATTLGLENSNELDRLGAISALLQKRVDLSKEAMQLTPQTLLQAAKPLTTTQAKADLQEIERLVGASRVIENKLLLEREQALQKHTRRTEMILYAGSALNVLLLGLAFYAMRMDLKSRRTATAILETKIRERSSELHAAYEKLEVENIEQKWGHAALQRIVDHHELVLNSMQEGIFIVSKNGRIISANPAAANLARREAKQLAGKSIGAVLLDDDRLPYPWEKHFLRSPIKNGRPIPLKPATIKQADGSLLNVQMACHPTRAQENLTGAVITVTSNHSPMQ